MEFSTNKAIDAATPKVNEMLNDTVLFGTPGWETHGAGLLGRINNIDAIISLGRKMGCDMSLETARAAALFVPKTPLR